MDNNDNVISIDVFSDVVCPWCYIGERRLEKALAQRADIKVELHWRPFQLQPEMPAEGKPWAEMVQQKFGGPARARQMFAHVSQIGAEEGIKLDFERVASAANTVNAHRLILLAGEHGSEWEMAQALFAAYFSEGRNLNDSATLVEIASNVGLDADEARDYLASDRNTLDVLESQTTAAQYGINGVPFYVFNDRYGLSGAQPSEVFLQVLDTVQRELLTGVSE